MNAPVKSPPVSFAEAFIEMQHSIGAAIKASKNPAFKSDYADLNAVWEAIKDPLHDHGFGVVQHTDFDDKDVWVATTLLHSSGEKMTGRYPLRPTRADPQGYGGALTYAKRYSLCAMLGVVAEKDDDGNTASAGARNTQSPPPNGAAAALAPAQQANGDIAPMARNWVNEQKEIINACATLPELTEWLDHEGGGSWTNPIPSSKLKKLATSQGAMFKELKEYYLAKLNRV